MQTNDEEAMTELVKCPPHVTHSLLNTQERSTLVNFTAVIDPKKYRVEQLIPGRDGKVRSAIIKVSSNNGKTQLLKRVIQHLVPIEVRAESNNSQVQRPPSTQLQEPQPSGHSNSTNQRPRRNAAIQGELSRRQLLNI